MTTNHVFESEGVSIFGEKVLTVGQLRQVLASVPDDVHVVIANDEWYVNVSTVATPDEERAEYCAVTLFQGSVFDARQ